MLSQTKSKNRPETISRTEHCARLRNFSFVTSSASLRAPAAIPQPAFVVGRTAREFSGTSDAMNPPEFQEPSGDFEECRVGTEKCRVPCHPQTRSFSESGRGAQESKLLLSRASKNLKPQDRCLPCAVGFPDNFCRVSTRRQRNDISYSS